MKTPEKQIRDVHCPGTMPGTNIKCREVLFQTDGELLMVGELVINDHLEKQRIKCPKCGFVKVWKRKKADSDDKTAN